MVGQLTNDWSEVNNDSDSEGERKATGTAEIDTATILRRAQEQKLNDWMSSNEAYESILKSTTHDTNEAGSLTLSHWAFNQSERIVKNPRQYQLDLFERAKTQNTIAVLDTGSGKTLIAILLLGHIINEELDPGCSTSGSRVSFFLVPTVILAYQQHGVLEHNIDHPVARICGEDHPEEWNKEQWQDVVQTHRVVICTADILLHCLAHGYVHMQQVNLLIFDEAHHTKKNHAYSRIIKDFYLSPESRTGARPRIFGMTASPIDGKGDVVTAAKQLETLLDSKIVTTPNFGLGSIVSLPSEEILNFPPSPIVLPQSKFLDSIKAQADGYDDFSAELKSAGDISRHLGLWCADQFLASCFSGRAIDKRKRDIAHQCYQKHKYDVGELNERMAYVERIEQHVSTMRTTFTTPTYETVSPKVAVLVRYLEARFSRQPDQRCIVFVQARHTARVLAKLTEQLCCKDVKAEFLVGFNARDEENDIVFRRQKSTLAKFRGGEINCIFATSVAEEGLDIPDCNMVIRFDLYFTMIQYVQSRGRARKPGSVFVHMIEAGNIEHHNLHSQVKQHENSMRQFCQGVSPDNILDGNDDILEIILGKEKGQDTYTEESTGAKLTYGNAPLCLARFVAAIPQQPHDNLTPIYDDTRDQQDFLATVILPDSAPFRSVSGKPQRRRDLAKRSAAFAACVELRKRNFIDEHLKPIYTKQVPKMANALLAMDMERKSKYPMMTKPGLWDFERGIPPKELWAVIIYFPDGIGTSYQPIMLLTRSRLPQLPAFAIFLDGGESSTVCSVRLQEPMTSDFEVLQRLTSYTCRVFEDLFSKTFDPNPSDFTYWLAPVHLRLSTALDPEQPLLAAKDYIDWTLLNLVDANPTQKWTPDTDASTLIDRVIVDPRHGGRKFYSKQIVKHLTPLSQVPPAARLIKQSHGRTSVLGNSISGSKKTMDTTTWNLEQPVILAEMIPTRRDTLSAPEENTTVDTYYLCPEPLNFSLIPRTAAVALYFLPGIIHRIESYLIADEACTKLNLDCALELALAAITKHSEDGDNAESEDSPCADIGDSREENYERLEFLGDTFLKMATSLSTFLLHPDMDPFQSHVTRMVMLCNKNLFQVATSDWQLDKYVRSKGFSRRLWYPEGLKLLKGKSISAKDEQDKTHALAQKTIADVCEALIGAAFVSHNVPGRWEPAQWTEAIRAVTIMVKNQDHAMVSWQDYINTYQSPSYLRIEASAAELHVAHQVQSKHKYQFRQPRLLISAFTHPSCVQTSNHVPFYERLEFLGDALLDMVIVSHIFYRFPRAGPQWLTEHKMAMVSNKFLGALCVEMGFHKHLQYFSSALVQPITDYVQEIRTAKEEPNAKSDYWTKVSEPPKCLADVVEAYVAAIFIDSGFDYGEVQRFFDEHIMKCFEDMNLYDTFANQNSRDTVREFFKHTFGCQAVELMVRDVPSVVPSNKKQTVAAVVFVHESLMAHCIRGSIYPAKSHAAKAAMEKCRNLEKDAFRERFGCNCVTGKADEQADGNVDTLS